MANGRVFDATVVSDDIQGWAAEITYSYSAVGEYYSGLYRRGFRLKKNAEAFLEIVSRVRHPFLCDTRQSGRMFPRFSYPIWVS